MSTEYVPFPDSSRKTAPNRIFGNAACRGHALPNSGAGLIRDWQAGRGSAKICYIARHVTPDRLPVLTYKMWAGASATAPASDVQQMHLWALSPREMTQLEPWLW